MSSSLLRDLAAHCNAWTTHTTWWVLSGFLLVGLGCAAVSAGHLVQRARRDRDARRALAIGVALFAAALALRWLVPERVHYTFNDEYEYVEHARRLLATGEYRLWTGPPGGVYLYALAFRLFGATTDVVFATTIVLGSLCAPALYGALRALGAERALAVLAAALLAVAPLHVKHSASASLEVVSLLFLLLAVATFLRALRAPGWLTALAFAASLFAALTTRVENWALLALLGLVAFLWRREARRPAAGQVAVVVAAVVLAAAYLPGILDAPIRYDPWWKSRLPALELLGTNLAFWLGGDPLRRKVPLLLAVLGAVAMLRRSPRVVLFWLAFLALYSVVFVGYGLNVGWTEEAHQPPPWGARGAGHDMFRFNVVLLPPVALLLAGGLLALGRGAAALLAGRGPVAAWPRAARLATLGAAGAVLAALLVGQGELASYRPLAFVASPYNRAFAIAEFRFLHEALRGAPPGTVCYVLPPSVGLALGEVEFRPLDELAARGAGQGGAPQEYVYVRGGQLAVPRLLAAFEAVRARHRLREVAQRAEGPDRFYLFAVERGPGGRFAG